MIRKYTVRRCPGDDGETRGLNRTFRRCQALQKNCAPQFQKDSQPPKIQLLDGFGLGKFSTVFGSF